jgi:hypothetical protein
MTNDNSEIEEFRDLGIHARQMNADSRRFELCCGSLLALRLERP